MPVNDLEALFDSVDGLKEDLMEYGTIAAAAVGANVAFNMGVNFLFTKWTNPPDWARKYGIPAVAVLTGLVGGKFVGKYSRKAGMGVAIGLVAGGISMLAKQFAPNLPVAGLADDDEEYDIEGLGASRDELLLGLGAQPDLFQKYLGSAPTSVEEQVNGFGAPVSVEEQMNGFGAPVSVEEQVSAFDGLGGFEGAATFA